jgi:pyruvate formate lyase activating enzyme
VIKPGKTGICQARENQAGKLISTVYGYPAAVDIDPIEKKPLFHFQPGSLSYSIGTYGCNFHCLNCQNHSLSQAKNIQKKNNSAEYMPPEKIVEDALANDCASLSFTYNEPTVFGEYALDIMKLSRQTGLKNVWVTNGYMSKELIGDIVPYLDAVNLDLKSFDQRFYQEICGAKLDAILETAKIFKREQIHLEITTLIIPSVSDDIATLGRLADFIVSQLDEDTPWHISKFSPAISWKMKNYSPTGDDVIYEIYEIGREAGIKYVYVGNLPGDQKENTYCPKCGEMAIRRLGYHVERLDHGGRCAECDRPLDIIE